MIIIIVLSDFSHFRGIRHDENGTDPIGVTRQGAGIVRVGTHRRSPYIIERRFKSRQRIIGRLMKLQETDRGDHIG